MTDSPRRAPDMPAAPLTRNAGFLVQLLGCALALVILMAGALIARSRYVNARAEVLADMRREASVVAERVTQFFDGRFETLHAIAVTPAVRADQRAEAKAYFEQVVDNESSFSGGLSLIRTDGMMSVLSGFPLDAPPTDLSDRDYVQAVLQTGRPFYGNAIIGRRSGDPLLTVAVPIPGANNQVRGVLAGTIRIDLPTSGLPGISAELRDEVVVDASGQVVLDRGTVAKPFAAQPAFLDFARAADTGERAPAPDGSGAWAGAAAPLANSGWHAVILRDPDLVFAPSRAELRQALATSALLAGMIVALAVGAGVRFNRVAARERERADRDATALRHDIERHDELLGLIAHELRTPLSVIVGNTQLMARRYANVMPALAADTLHDVEAAARRLQRLLENMLVLSQAGAEAEPEMEPQRLPHLIQTTVSDFRARYPDYRVDLDLAPGLPVVIANSTFVDQVLWNLLSNAAKYAGAEAPITVHVSAIDGHVLTTVADAGPGMRDDEIPHVFEPHFRTLAARSHAAGLGLGLAVCRRLVEMQGGTISAHRNEGGGMTFAFTLPTLAEDPLPRSA